ncbi:UDP-glucuronosyltransferase 1-3 [Orchesella cincta]|uniref:UDP-glucuronosyltransferase 1-3 n=1 Tax=Orchesella cincta TaxID=48709 RepID=A0A1D2N2V3_ORCCI|nr:UDP-glucuronosyltransferase 1-3 [Orchesella cincta]
MKIFNVCFCAISFLSVVSSISGNNILFFHSISTRSHRSTIWPLAEKLADAGHNVTYIFPNEKRIGSHPKIEELTPSKMVKLMSDFVSDFDINIRLNDKLDEWNQEVFSRSLQFCEAFYDSPEIQKWLDRPGLNYDLVILDILSECGYGLVYKFKAKHVQYLPASVAPFTFDGIGIVPETSSIPDVSGKLKPSELSFMNRVRNTMMVLLWRYGYLDFASNVLPVIKSKLNLTDIPSLTEFERNTSLVMVNDHFIEDYPRSLPPMVVSLSGLLCNKSYKPNPLPEKISTFIEDSEGFIYISFGSAVAASAMPDSLRGEFFGAFRSLPKLKFLWRWAGSIPDNTPANVMFLPWFPQNDILAHPKIKGFVTQAGRPSTQEALCFAVPLITIPIFADQDYNANRLESIGAGILLDITNITPTLLKDSIQELIQNPQRKSRMIELSKMFKDRPMDPLENAFYWVEYVLHYDTSLLKPLGVDQTWYQRRLLDVYAFVLVVLVIVLTVLISITVATLSHRTAIWPLVEKLANAGHNITYIFPVDKRIGSHPNIIEFAPSKMVPLIKDFVSDFDINIKLNDKEMEWLSQAYSRSSEFCEAFYDSPEIQEWLAQPDLHYDLVMLDSLAECGYGLVHKFNAKHILFVPMVVPFLFDGLGVVAETSSLPEIAHHAKPTEMTFMSRVITTLMIIFWRYNFLDFAKAIEPIIKEKLNLTDEQFPSITEFEKNTSLVLVNNYFVEDYPISLPPMFVSFSGIGCKKDFTPEPLPEKISNFLKDAEGFVYVSFGSAVVASAMPISLREEFFGAFRSLPKIKFLWRWTGSVPDNTPANVLLLPWFPQNDILAHPKIKGFVTQAGRPSTQEALCFAVPLITIPFFADQDYNADRMEYVGGAMRLDIKNFSSTLLQQSLHELVYNPKLKNRMVELSSMFKDRPIDPLENAFYWTEYVLRHDTSLLKPLGIHQTWYQRRLLDVYLFLLVAVCAAVGTVVFLTLLTLKFVIRVVSSSQKIKSE